MSQPSVDTIRRASPRAKMAQLLTQAANPALQIHPVRLREAAKELATWHAARNGIDFPTVFAEQHWRDFEEGARRAITAAAEAV